MALDVKKEEFDVKVIHESQNKPVLVDFWASWCNPCKALGPILEKLEKEYQNRFLLLKINTETEKELAVRYKISSIPFVALFYNKNIKDSFVGALNENLIRKFLDKNLPHPSAMEIQTLIQKGMYENAGEKIISGNLKGEVFDEPLWVIFKYYLKRGENIESIKKFIDQMSDFGSKYNNLKNTFKAFYQQPATPEDLKAILHILNKEQIRESLDYFLKKIEESSGNERETQKNNLFVCFLLLEEDPVILEYRKKLSRILF